MIGAVAAALPWIVPPFVVLWRVRGSRSLDELPPDAPPDAPRLAVIIPARNEARNIERCARSVLASRYPALDVLVVDDRSDDGTGDLARAIAREDARLRVIASRPLPDGWFGKQWACAQGADAAADAELLCFTDADTTHAPDLLPRAVAALRADGADMVTVAGRQQMETFWERLIQPQVFGMLMTRFGGTESVNRSRSVKDKIANGQFILVRRAAYDAIGGHAAVRDKVAEDLALAQRLFSAGMRTRVLLGLEQLRTRMYTSLGELVRGWMKNVYAGARDAAPGGAVGRALLPLMLVLPSLMEIAPPLVLVAGALGLASRGLTLWAALATGAHLLWWLVVYARIERLPARYALAYPLGAAMLLYIMVRAITRGARVEWKGREYLAR